MFSNFFEKLYEWLLRLLTNVISSIFNAFASFFSWLVDWLIAVNLYILNLLMQAFPGIDLDSSLLHTIKQILAILNDWIPIDTALVVGELAFIWRVFFALFNYMMRVIAGLMKGVPFIGQALSSFVGK